MGLHEKPCLLNLALIEAGSPAVLQGEGVGREGRAGGGGGLERGVVVQPDDGVYAQAYRRESRAVTSRCPFLSI